MASLRSYLHAYRNLALMLVALALVMKALVPAGYMFAFINETLVAEVCVDFSSERFLKQTAISHAEAISHDKADEDQNARAKGGKACPYATLVMAAVSSAQAVFIVLALLFILALGFAPVATVIIPRSAFLSPPLRGPPAIS